MKPMLNNHVEPIPGTAVFRHTRYGQHYTTCLYRPTGQPAQEATGDVPVIDAASNLNRRV